ncbi:MAG: hypothetical protein KGJ01_03030 [Patescibacteria group bacterium]|nr:hypothetical protein [Patescibacteria group bacterium]
MYYRDAKDFMDSAGHEVGGEWYPRVTSIVSIKAKPELYRFYGQLKSFAEGEAIKKQSADEGTAVHNAVESIMLGEDPDVPSEIAPAVSAFMRFSDKVGIKVNSDWVEKMVAHPDERYSGTVDSVATIGGRIGILDIKTSLSVYRDYGLQTSAYFAVAKDVYKIDDLAARWILRIDQYQLCFHCGASKRSKGGKAKVRRPASGVVFPVHFDECDHEWSETRGDVELKEFEGWENDYSAFLGAKRLWEWENEYWLKRIGYLK